MFRRNVGGVDRLLRIVVGALALAAGLFLLREHAWGTATAVVGAVVLASGVVAYCPPYALLGISTAGGGPKPVTGRRAASER